MRPEISTADLQHELAAGRAKLQRELKAQFDILVLRALYAQSVVSIHAQYLHVRYQLARQRYTAVRSGGA